MFQAFYPKEYRDSTYTIDFQKLYQEGYRGILFDVDNTLVPHGAPATEESVELFRRLHEMGFSTCLISNNKEPRVMPFADAMETPYVYKAGKPKRSGYQKGMGDHGNGNAEHTFYRRSAVYRRLGSESGGAVFYPCKADRSEGGDSDCPQKISGKNRPVLL